MVYSLLFKLSILILPAFACEGQCIEGITRAFVGNYTAPIHTVFTETATKISKIILHSQHSTAAVSKLMQPLLDSYERNAYDAMEKAIFPSYFHGKCQVHGVDPAGCPNPDCPVVCGTPGSLVHFYSVLQKIAFNTTTSNLEDICDPSNKTYQAFEAAVLHESRMTSRSPRSLHSSHPGSTFQPHRAARDSRRALKKGTGKKGVDSSNDAITQLKSICQSMGQDLARQCGGSSSLSKCSWEEEMKAS